MRPIVKAVGLICVISLLALRGFPEAVSKRFHRGISCDVTLVVVYLLQAVHIHSDDSGYFVRMLFWVGVICLTVEKTGKQVALRELLEQIDAVQRQIDTNNKAACTNCTDCFYSLHRIFLFFILYSWQINGRIESLIDILGTIASATFWFAKIARKTVTLQRIEPVRFW